jgi:hypothetical protein
MDADGTKRRSACKGARDLPASALFLSASGVKRAPSNGTVQRQLGKARLTPGAERNKQRVARPSGCGSRQVSSAFASVHPRPKNNTSPESRTIVWGTDRRTPFHGHFASGFEKSAAVASLVPAPVSGLSRRIALGWAPRSDPVFLRCRLSDSAGRGTPSPDPGGTCPI